MTSSGSPIAAIAMISEFYGEGKINRKETLMATVATWFPRTIYESLVYISPTIIPVIELVGRCVPLFICIGRHDSSARVYCRQSTFDPERLYSCEFASETGGMKLSIKTALKWSVLNSVKLLKRVVIFAFPVSILVFVLLDLGSFDILSQYLEWMSLPLKVLAVIPLLVANSTAAYVTVAYVTVADSMETEILDFKLALLTSLAGNLVVSTRYILTHRLPYYSGIFAPGLA